MKKFQAYASVFNKLDAHNDVILHGAYFELKSNPRKMINLPILWQHNHDKNIGKIISIWEDSIGLFIRGYIDISDRTGVDSYLKMKQGVVGVSIGYHALLCHKEKNITYISKIELNEISIVTFPSNKNARITFLN